MILIYMEARAEYELEPNFASLLMLELAQEQSVDDLMQKLTHRLMENRPAIARFRIWLVEKDADGNKFLQARASARKSSPDSEAEYTLPDDPFTRIPFGSGIVGGLAQRGEQMVVNDLDKNPGELSRVDWLKAEKIKGFNCVPAIFKGEVLGVAAVFSRENIPEAGRVWANVFANHLAGVLANTRAFEEIQQLKAQLERQNAYLEEEVVEAKAFGDLVGQSAALRQIISQIDLVAPTDASVLILGETGTGKELVAREIHRRSARHDKPMIRVNCASIPKDLFESEFFGHARGSFTGAIKDRAGRFETAEGGTLFLDEIGEVPLDLQSKLLRVLQEKRYERVGEDRTRHADVRIIGATNRDLKNEMMAGRFREDLFYRLNVFPVQVAALRERMEDVPSLAKHFIELSVKELRCPKPRLTRAGVTKLQSYDWPGNIRELRNVIERAVILARGGVLDFDLPSTNISPAPLLPSTGQKAEYFTEAELLQRERENLLIILEKTGWKIKGPDGAAELLGIKPTTLLSRINKMQLVRPDNPNRRPIIKQPHFASPAYDDEQFNHGGLAVHEL